MSNIYSHEPPTNGKVVLKTTVGDLDIELWSKETPKACRNFVQLCMEGYYDGVIFHRIVPGFIAQCGDPTGTGHGGDSIYGKPFKDEIHSRLRFVRRGLVAMANAGADDNGSQFFFTLDATPDLNKKHTIFAKVAGDTIYNMLKLGECEVDSDDRPTTEIRIHRTKILANPFEDIVPRVTKREKGQEVKKKDKTSSKATKNFKLLSFGEEAEEDEEATNRVTESMKGRSKSSHDLLEDSKLSSRPAVETSSPPGKRGHLEVQEDSDEESDEEQVRESVRKKLKSKHSPPPKHSRKDSKGETHSAKKPTEDEDDRMKHAKLEDLKAEARRLKKEIAASRKGEVLEPAANEPEEPAKNEPDEEDDKPFIDGSLTSFKSQYKKYKIMRNSMPKKGGEREKQTLAMLAKFKKKLQVASELPEKTAETKTKEGGGGEFYDDSDEDASDISWLGHELRFDAEGSKVIDANVDDADRYEISDPRNPITKRRREASKAAQKDKSRGKR